MQNRKSNQKKKAKKSENNAIFCKSIENPMNKIDVKIVTDKKKQTFKWLLKELRNCLQKIFLCLPQK